MEETEDFIKTFYVEIYMYKSRKNNRYRQLTTTTHHPQHTTTTRGSNKAKRSWVSYRNREIYDTAGRRHTKWKSERERGHQLDEARSLLTFHHVLAIKR